MITVSYNTKGFLTYTKSVSVLTAEYASLISMEFGRNPVVNDEAAFDLYAP